MRMVTDRIKAGKAEFGRTDLGLISDWFWNASKTGVLSVLDGWSETKPFLLFTCHVGMVG